MFIFLCFELGFIIKYPTVLKARLVGDKIFLPSVDSSDSSRWKWTLIVTKGLGAGSQMQT